MKQRAVKQMLQDFRQDIKEGIKQRRIQEQEENKTIRTNDQDIKFTTYKFLKGWRTLRDYYDGREYNFTRLYSLMQKLSR